MNKGKQKEPSGSSPSGAERGRIRVKRVSVEEVLQKAPDALGTLIMRPCGMVALEGLAEEEGQEVVIRVRYKRIHCVPGMCMEKTMEELVEEVCKDMVDRGRKEGFEIAVV